MEKRTLSPDVPYFSVAGKTISVRPGFDTADAISALNAALACFEVSSEKWETNDKLVRVTSGESLKLSIVSRVEAQTV